MIHVCMAPLPETAGRAALQGCSRIMLTTPPRYFDRNFETLGREEIQELRDRLIEDTLAVARDNHFYSSFYARAGVDVTRVRRAADLRELPIIRKADILADAAKRPPYGTRLATPPESIANVVESSGTSAAGKEIQALTASDLQRILDAEQVGFVWAGATEGTEVAVNVPVGITAAGYWWNLALHQIGCNTLRLGGMRTEQRLGYLKTYGAEQMLIDSHYLRRMTYLAGTYGYGLRHDFPRLKAIFVGGGGWTDQEAEQWADEWGAVLYEQYGSSQRCIAWTCEGGILQHNGRAVVHALPHHYLLEVVDPVTGKHVAEGEDGEIVVTLFGHEAMPLIRYGTGDHARFRTGESCPCRRAFDGIEAGSVGRLDDMIRVRGRNLWPEMVDKVVFARVGVVDYQGRVWTDQAAGERLSIRIWTFPEAAAEAGSIAHELKSSLRLTTGLNFDVDTKPVTAMEIEAAAQAAAKPRRWFDNRGTTSAEPGWPEAL